MLCLLSYTYCFLLSSTAVSALSCRFLCPEVPLYVLSSAIILLLTVGSAIVFALVVQLFSAYEPLFLLNSTIVYT